MWLIAWPFKCHRFNLVDISFILQLEESLPLVQKAPGSILARNVTLH